MLLESLQKAACSDPAGTSNLSHSLSLILSTPTQMLSSTTLPAQSSFTIDQLTTSHTSDPSAACPCHTFIVGSSRRSSGSVELFSLPTASLFAMRVSLLVRPPSGMPCQHFSVSRVMNSASLFVVVLLLFMSPPCCSESQSSALRVPLTTAIVLTNQSHQCPHNCHTAEALCARFIEAVIC